MDFVKNFVKAREYQVLKLDWKKLRNLIELNYIVVSGNSRPRIDKIELDDEGLTITMSNDKPSDSIIPPAKKD